MIRRNVTQADGRKRPIRSRWNERIRATLASLLISIAMPSIAAAWDEDGHAIITLLAIDALPTDMPDWLRSPDVRERLVYLSSEPDRWRGQRDFQLDHINGPDHYLDEEMLHPFGLSVRSLPRFRVEFTDMMATQRALHPEKFAEPAGEEKPRPDRDYTRKLPGFLPYRITELQWQVAASWTQLKTYEAHPDRVTPGMIRNARENIVYSMGILSHYVGDGSQPLHMTIHHHGWVGPNPKGYTRDNKFHAYIDGDVLTLHNISYDTLKDRVKPARKFSKKNNWQDIVAYLYETFELVEPLYELEKTGELKRAPGKQFIEGRMLEGGAALAGVWKAAYDAARIDEFRENRLKSEFPHEPGRKRALRDQDEKKPADSQ
ncbi:MAG: hypothetical protein KF841_04980 [Phycisphaerae bacterium]|nr:hypothetical protein [Phycisphaerae bacterium]